MHAVQFWDVGVILPIDSITSDTKYHIHHFWC